MNFTDNLHDSRTLPAALEQHHRLTGMQAKAVYADRGYAGPRQINNIPVYLPKPDKNISQARRKHHRCRAAIEPVIGHLKHDYRMLRNFLKGSYGDSINVMMAAAAMNFKRMMNLWKAGNLSLVQFFLFYYSCFFNRHSSLLNKKNLE
jgi:transposase, IS5 family